MSDLFERLVEMRRTGARGVLATLVEVRGSVPQSAGARMIVHPDGNIEGTVGGGALEHKVRALAGEVLAAGQPRLEQFDLLRDLGMSCGGFSAVFLEPIGVADRLFLFGAGHVAEHLCDMAARCGFLVTVCDERDELRTPDRFPRAAALSPAGRGERLGELEAEGLGRPEEVYAVVVTHSHRLDFGLVKGLLPRGLKFLAMVGSRTKRAQLDALLGKAGFGAEEIAKVRSPAGVPLGGRSPAEVAVSIVAQLVQVRAEEQSARNAQGQDETRA